MARRTDNWLLVDLVGVGHSVVYSKSVLSPVNNDFKVGEVITVNWRGEPTAATLIARAKERDPLDKKLKLEKPGPSPKPVEEGADFSSSGSSWAPSDDDAASGDSDTDINKFKPEILKRQYINRRNSKRVLTPSHRANAVIPKAMQNNNCKKNDSGRKRSYNEISRDRSFNKSMPDSTKRNNTSKNAGKKQKLSVEFRELEEMGKNFRLLFHMIEKLKEPYNTNSTNFNESIIVDLPIKNNTDTLNEEADQEIFGENENEEDFDRSDDNVLITNKYDNRNNREASPKERVKTCENNTSPGENEWIPIGSGKTMIHVDQFRKVNWKSYTIATRTLLLAVFPRRILATHSLTGKKSPAFLNKPAKMCLDPKIISDVIMEIMDRFDVKENLVRSIITTKCADECKMLKQRKNKKASLSNNNQENLPPKEESGESKKDNIK